jgi:hypothetical protein
MKAPFAMPASGAAQQEFEPQRIDYSAAEAGGRVGGVQAGFPLWLATWTIGRIGADKSDEWRAFLAKCRGATRRFLGRDLSRPFPKLHRGGFARMTIVGGGPFTGDASDWSEVITADGDSQLTLQGVPPGLMLSVGDYVGFKWTATEDSVVGLPWQAVVRVITGGMADDSGEITVTSEPPVPSCIPPEAIAHLDNPACVMALITEKTNLDAIDRRLAIKGGTVVGVQDLRA